MQFTSIASIYQSPY